MDRYRKHFSLFEYWNAQLLQELGSSSSVNSKRIRRASAESFQELQTLQGMLHEERASRLTPWLEERGRIDRDLQHGSSTPSQLDAIRRLLETQTRHIHRELFWRAVEDHLKDGESP